MSLKDIQQFTIEAIIKLPKKVVSKIIRTLLNAIEDYTSEVTQAKAEIQKLKDEIHRLKGEKGKPDIKESKDQEEAKEESKSEKHSQQCSSSRARSSKKEKIQIHRVERIKVPPSELPEDAEYKGTRSVVIQDIQIHLDNICFEMERFYSPSVGKVVEGEIPFEYQGSQFGPGIRSYVLMMHYQARIPQALLHRILSGFGVQICEAQIGQILLSSKNDVFQGEQDQVQQAAMQSSTYQQIDDTGARMNGENLFTIVTCNEKFCSFTTSVKKDRLSAVQALLGSTPLCYVMNRVALDYIDGKISNKRIIEGLDEILSDRLYNREEFEVEVLNASFLQDTAEALRKHVLEGAAIAFYRGSAPSVLRSLICDDAPQFKGILESVGLCWVHEGRHYKNLIPRSQEFRNILDDFMDQFWDFYKQLKRYKQEPSEQFGKELERQFDALFSLETGYYALNQILKKTRAKKESLLLVLKYPEIPLHNNTSEQDIREKVIQRKIRNCFRSWRGAKASDTFLSLLATCRKQRISFWEYIKDRLYQTHKIPSLALLIGQSHPLPAS